MLQLPVVIAAAGTANTVFPVVPSGYRLTHLIEPTRDSATITATLSVDGTNFFSVVDSAGSALGVIGGAASIGNRITQVLETLSYCTEGKSLKLTLGSGWTAGGTIVAVCTPVNREANGG